MRNDSIRIKIIDDHDEAYYIWKKLGVRNRPLLHFDAHIDFAFHDARPAVEIILGAKSKNELKRQLETRLLYEKLGMGDIALTNIGNYIYPAMRDGIVSDFYWIVPGGRREMERSLKTLKGIIKTLSMNDPFSSKGIRYSRGRLSGKVYNRNFIFTTIEDLPSKIDGAIVDIDTDYLTTPTVRKSGVAHDVGKRRPWIWPEELVLALKRKDISPCCVTIAYSVNGGFTPIVYKFLGDEIALFFNNATDGFRVAAAKRNKAIEFFTRRNNTIGAISILENLSRELNKINEAAAVKTKFRGHVHFLLFRLFERLGSYREAKENYRRSIALDKGYRIRDNNYGPIYLGLKRKLGAAEKEFKAILAVDRNNSYALSGLGAVHMRRRDFKKARGYFEKAVRHDKYNKEALLEMGQSEFRLKHYDRAIRYLKKYKSRNKVSPIANSLLAEAYSKSGDIGRALEEYKMAVEFGMDLNIYLKLALLLKKMSIPERHAVWIRKRIDIFERFKENLPKRLPARTRSMIPRIGAILNAIR